MGNVMGSFASDTQTLFRWERAQLLLLGWLLLWMGYTAVSIPHLSFSNPFTGLFSTPLQHGERSEMEPDVPPLHRYRAKLYCEESLTELVHFPEQTLILCRLPCSFLNNISRILPLRHDVLVTGVWEENGRFPLISIFPPEKPPQF